MNLTSNDISPELALKLFNTNAFFVLKNFPIGMEFGIDYNSWTADKKFLGIKMIPPGLHFIYIQIKNSPRISFYYNFKINEILYRKWNQEKKDFDSYEADSTEIERIRSNLKNLNTYLAPYPFSTYQRWISLSSFINEKTVLRLKTNNKLGQIVSQDDFFEDDEKEIQKHVSYSINTSTSETNLSRYTLNWDKKNSNTAIKFSVIPEVCLKNFNENFKKLDNSDIFLKLLNSLNDDYKEILAEFQYAFIAFLMGQTYQGYNQWKKIIHIVLSCRDALILYPNFYVNLIMVLFYQIKECNKEFLNLTNEKDNFVISTLKIFFANINDLSNKNIDQKLLKKSKQFKMYLQKLFDCSFDLT